MPANLGPEFLTAREKYNKASTPQEQLQALQAMLRTIPKHKGTDKMQANLKKRISRLKDDMVKQSQGGKEKPFWVIERQGAGRLVVAGPPNVGKSSLMQATTNAKADVAPYPYTTQQPMPGMMPYKNIQYQLIDMPPFLEGHPGWHVDVLRTADIILIMIDLGSDEVLMQLEQTVELLHKASFELLPPQRNNDIESTIIEEENLFSQANSRKAILLANKSDCEGASIRLEMLREIAHDLCPTLPLHTISCTTMHNITDLNSSLFDYLDIVRIYTKAPGQKANFDEPIVMPRGTTLIEAAAEIHKDFAEQLKYARVWGAATFDGQRVPSDYVLIDEDIVEFHI